MGADPFRTLACGVVGHMLRDRVRKLRTTVTPRDKHPRAILEKGKPRNLSDTREPRSAAQKSASSPPTPYSRARGDAFPIRRR
eukprot:scaffold145624_cov148-Phaeocystis_antarctica.AAC.1